MRLALMGCMYGDISAIINYVDLHLRYSIYSVINTLIVTTINVLNSDNYVKQIAVGVDEEKDNEVEVINSHYWIQNSLF